MSKHLILFLVILALVLVAVAAAKAAEVSSSISLTDTEWAVMRAYAAEQLRSADAEAVLDDKAIDEEALRLCRSFAARGLRDVVEAQMRARLSSLSVVEQEAILAPVVSEKIVAAKVVAVVLEPVVVKEIVK